MYCSVILVSLWRIVFYLEKWKILTKNMIIVLTIVQLTGIVLLSGKCVWFVRMCRIRELIQHSVYCLVYLEVMPNEKTNCCSGIFFPLTKIFPKKITYILYYLSKIDAIFREPTCQFLFYLFFPPTMQKSLLDLVN